MRLGGVYCWLLSPYLKSGLYPPSPPAPFLKAGGMPVRTFPGPVVFLSSRAFWNMTVKPSDVAGFFTSHSPNLGSGRPCPLSCNATACIACASVHGQEELTGYTTPDFRNKLTGNKLRMGMHASCMRLIDRSSTSDRRKSAQTCRKGKRSKNEGYRHRHGREGASPRAPTTNTTPGRPPGTGERREAEKRRNQQ